MTIGIRVSDNSYVLVANTSYILPVVFVQYVALRAEAYLDALNRNPLVLDSFSTSELVALQTTKTFFEAVSLLDEQVFEVNKGLSDSVGTTDTVDLLVTFIRDFADTFNISDVHALAVAKEAADLVATIDEQTLTISKLIPDGVAMNDLADIDDGIAFDFVASFTNVAFAADATSLDNSKPLENTYTLADLASIEFSRAELDSAVPVDDVALAIAAARTDEIVVSEVAAVSFARGVEDGISVSDVFTKDAGKGPQDSVSVDDAGSLIAQGYCDILYFAEDYVGEARTFT